eukprot:TRINITY_DN2685_c0_g1_i2.p1 TRINITY_DN2685_c0_g1~~TRINITY_DN2685_c0_g1_i2.p1  ORF type:complete len:130 (-),score=11.25 TRINITY_DN2685_c0_g1_i2:31-420(-)
MAAVSSAASSVCRVALSRLEARDASAHQEILDALKTKNFFFVKLNAEQCDTVNRCFSASKEFFASTDLKSKNAFRVSSKLGYNKNTPKERLQFRLSGAQRRQNCGTLFRSARSSAYNQSLPDPPLFCFP